MKKKEKRRGSASPESSGFSRRSFIQTLGLAGVGATVPLIQGCGTSESGPEIPAEGLGPAPVEVALSVNGQEVKVKVEPRVTLLDASATTSSWAARIPSTSPAPSASATA